MSESVKTSLLSGIVSLIVTLAVVQLVVLPKISDLSLGADGDSNFTNLVASGDITAGDDLVVSGGTINATHSNLATSTIVAGCIQTYATSTASPIKVTWGKVGSTATTTLYGGTSVFLPYGEYGTCPNR